VANTSRPKTPTHRQKLHSLRSEVLALRRQLRQAQRLATVGTMTAMVSHELNNILTPVANYAQMAQKNPALSDKAIARAAEGGQRATSICRAILDVAAEGPAEQTAVNVLEVIDGALAAMARDPAKDGIALTVDVPADLTVRARRTELQQVMLNLLLNARSAVLEVPGPRRIDLSARRRGRQVVLEVADNGSGIDPRHRDKLFTPFFTTKPRAADGSSGYGLGLAFCRHAVEAMGGTITAGSAPGGGATFIVRLSA
jgi:signal transduction histidine kinase